MSLAPDLQKRLELFQFGYRNTTKSFAQLRGDIHAAGLEFPDMLAYVLADLETNLNRLNTLITTQNIHAKDNAGRTDSQGDSSEAHSQDGRETPQ